MIEFHTCDTSNFDFIFLSPETEIILENILLGNLENIFRHGVQIETPM